MQQTDLVAPCHYHHLMVRTHLASFNSHALSRDSYTSATVPGQLCLKNCFGDQPYSWTPMTRRCILSATSANPMQAGSGTTYARLDRFISDILQRRCLLLAPALSCNASFHHKYMDKFVFWITTQQSTPYTESVRK